MFEIILHSAQAVYNFFANPFLVGLIVAAAVPFVSRIVQKHNQPSQEDVEDDRCRTSECGNARRRCFTYQNTYSNKDVSEDADAREHKPSSDSSSDSSDYPDDDKNLYNLICRRPNSEAARNNPLVQKLIKELNTPLVTAIHLAASSHQQQIARTRKAKEKKTAAKVITDKGNSVTPPL